MAEVLLVALLGLATTSSSIVGAALGLYVPLSKRLLACVLAFAAGGLISALAIDLAYSGAIDLHELGFDADWDSLTGGMRLLTRDRDEAFRLLGLALIAPRFSSSVSVMIRSVRISSISVPSNKAPGLSGAI